MVNGTRKRLKKIHNSVSNTVDDILIIIFNRSESTKSTIWAQWGGEQICKVLGEGGAGDLRLVAKQDQQSGTAAQLRRKCMSA